MLKLKDGKFQFVLLDHLFAEGHDGCQLRKIEQHVASHCWALPSSAGVEQTMVAPLVPFSMKDVMDKGTVIDFMRNFDASAPPVSSGGDVLPVGYSACVPLVTLEHVEDKKTQRAQRAPLEVENEDEDEENGSSSSSDNDADDIDSGSDWINPSEEQLERDEVELGAFVRDLVADGEGIAKRIKDSLQNDHTGSLNKRARSQSCVSELVGHLRDTNQSAALTTEELEEEAVLLLVKHFQQTRSDGDLANGGGRGGVDVPRSDSVVHAAIGRADADAGGADADAAAAAEDLSAESGAESTDDEADESDEADDHADNIDEDDVETRDTAAAAAGRPVQPVQPQYLKLWKQSFDLTVMCLCDRLSRNKNSLGYHDEVALLMYSESVGAPAESDQSDEPSEQPVFFFVKWTRPTELEGRYVRVEYDQPSASFRVVYAPASMFGQKVPTESFKDPRFTCFLNVCGAASRRLTGNSRDQLPQHVVRFAQLTGTLVGRIASATWFKLRVQV